MEHVAAGTMSTAIHWFTGSLVDWFPAHYMSQVRLRIAATRIDTHLCAANCPRIRMRAVRQLLDWRAGRLARTMLLLPSLSKFLTILNIT
jgi:hypothetical protein